MPVLDWIGKKAVVNHHREVPYRLIHCDKDKSVGDPDAGNLLVKVASCKTPFSGNQNGIGWSTNTNRSANPVLFCKFLKGDNLEALKALLPYYAGKVKCIYIDPPYNIGNEAWAYNDNVSSPEIIIAWLSSVVGREAEDFSRHDRCARRHFNLNRDEYRIPCAL